MTALGGIHTYNVLHGFPEALIRGYRSGFLKDGDYHHLTQCDTIEVRALFYCSLYVCVNSLLVGTITASKTMTTLIDPHLS